MNCRSGLLLILVFFVASIASRADDQLKSLIGKSGCSSDLQLSYGMRLDRTQRAYLNSYNLNGAQVVTIVQLSSNQDNCGVIRDVAEGQHKDDAYVFECVDRRSPSFVTVGTWRANHPKPLGPATQAWRVDLKNLKFIAVDHAPNFVYCRPEHGAGSDDGLGLSDYAKQRLKHR